MTTFEQLRAAIASKPISVPDSVPVPEARVPRRTASAYVPHRCERERRDPER